MGFRYLYALLFVTFIAEAKESDFDLPKVEVHSNITKSSEGFIQTSPSYIHKTITEESIGNGEDLKDFLYNEPNIDTVGGPRGSAQVPQIRGLGSERTLILDEGVRQNFQSGHNGRLFTDFNLMREVEVIKGPWSSLYGSGAMGGVINYRRVQASDYKMKKDIGAELNASFATAAESFSQTAILYSNSQKLKPLVAVRNLNSGNTRLGSGRDLPYSKNQLNEYLVSLEYDISQRQKLTLKSVLHRNESASPINPNIDTTQESELADHRYQKEDIVLDYRYKGNRWSLTFKPYFRKSKILNSRISDGREDLRTVETLGADAWVNRSFSLSESVSLSNIFGLEYFKDVNTGTRDGVQLLSFPNGESEYQSLYAQQTYFFGERFEVSPGLRYDSYENTDDNGVIEENKGEELTARVQLSYKLTKSSNAFVSFGQSFNAPRLQDIFISDLHFPSPAPPMPDNFFVPNPDLKPEESDNYEIGYSGDFFSERLGVKLTAFHSEASNFIARDVDIMNGTTTFQNEDRVKLSGVELLTDYKWNKRLKLSLSYGQTRSRVVGETEPLPTTLPDKWSFGAGYRFNQRLHLKTVAVLYERQDNVPEGTEETGGYLLQNLFLTYALNKNFNLRFSVNNVFDRSYTQHGNGIEGVGRDIQLLAKYYF